MLIVAFAICVLLIGAGLIAASASAQQQGETTNATGPEGTQVADQLGDLVVHSYSYDEEEQEMTINATWTGSTSTQVTLTEMLTLDSEGSTQISFKQIRLDSGERTEITIGAEKSDGTAAILVTTPQSVENSNALILQSGDGADRGPVPFGLASIAVAGSAVGAAGLSFAFVRRDREGDDEAEDRRERIA
jgi:archaellum component FlaF (FlaF/FlaG flagellin family)